MRKLFLFFIFLINQKENPGEKKVSISFIQFYFTNILRNIFTQLFSNIIFLMYTYFSKCLSVESVCWAYKIHALAISRSYECIFVYVRERL